MTAQRTPVLVLVMPSDLLTRFVLSRASCPGSDGWLPEGTVRGWVVIET
jgi:hypothetical protein